ncbi:MAG TPA: leucyl aminopeptidase [Thermodesulfovibrionales bacterium]|nr:leucyl aminopeptidase [Thermodesulfovibrionales bacterium]
MNVILRNTREADYRSDALILPLYEDEGPAPHQDIDKALKGLIGKVLTSRDFTGKQNQLVLLHTLNAINPRRVLLAGLGKRTDITAERLRQAGGKAATHLDGMGASEASLSVRSLLSSKTSPLPFIEGSLLALYKFRRYRKENTQNGLKTLTVLGKYEKTFHEAIKWVEQVASAVHFARDLVNTPANDMTPAVLARIAKELAKGKLSVRVLERADARREGMGAFLSVARGSAEPPKFIVLRYNGGTGAPVALIGKAITFDSGGISLKPGEGMEKMKYDMAGGAAVLGVMKAVSEAKLPVNLLGILPAAENLPGGTASKPGDVVKTVGGKTVEIVNTDAEGRLVLADAIGYARRMKPAAVIDMATLTGACSVALGSEAIAMMGNADRLMERLKKAGDETYERVWQMPLFEEYLEYIKSDVADLKNTGGKTGSLVTAGYFLREFAGDTPWVHLDIAGTAWVEKEKPYVPKGATGVGVRLMTNFLREAK